MKKILGWFMCIILLLVSIVPLAESSTHTTLNSTHNNFSSRNTEEDWKELQKILPTNNGEFFGCSVSIDNDTALIGANSGNNPGMKSRHQGSVYVFIRDGLIWTRQAILVDPDGQPGDQFGCAVSIDGDTALIGACLKDDRKGAAFVFTRTATTWSLQQTLEAADGESWDIFGNAVSLAENTAFISADESGAENTGSVYVFTRNGSIWTQQQKLVPSHGESYFHFGCSVSLDGNTALIGGIGSAYVFTYTGLNWTEQMKISLPIGDSYLGCSVSLDGDTALIGDVHSCLPGYTGAAYIFIRSGDTWHQQAILMNPDGTSEDDFGLTVSLDRDTALVGASYLDQSRPGSVYVFTRNGSLWTWQRKLMAWDANKSDLFGCGLCIHDDVALIGAELNNEMGYGSGGVYVFSREPIGLDVRVGSGLGVRTIIKNNGLYNLSNVSWEIHVEGGIFHHINTTTNGTIDLQAGDSKTLPTRIFFGLGPIMISVKAFYVTETVEAAYFFIFSFVKYDFINS